MKYLVDTHVFLWMLCDEKKLSKAAREIIEPLENKLYFSAASGLQIAYLVKEKKIEFPKNTIDYINEMLEKYSIQNLPINLYHSLYSVQLPEIHNDPFARILAAQSVLEDMPIVTNDPHLIQYSVKTIW